MTRHPSTNLAPPGRTAAHRKSGSPALPPHAAPGFSLPELLVVFAIIAILASLGMVVGMRMREGGQASQTRTILQVAANVSNAYEGQMGGPVEPPPPGEHPTRYFVDRVVGGIIDQPRVPEAASVLQTLREHLMEVDGDPSIVDAWKKEIEYRHPDDEDSTPTLRRHHRPYFASAGTDGEWNTEDDLYSFELD